jgi:hypothetical protein
VSSTEFSFFFLGLLGDSSNTVIDSDYGISFSEKGESDTAGVVEALVRKLLRISILIIGIVAL